MARGDDLARKFYVRAVEVAAARLIEDADEIDRRVGAGRELLERERIVDICLENVHRRQENEMLGALPVSRRHDDVPTRGNQSRDDMAPDETAAAQHQDSRCAHRGVSLGSAGRTASGGAAPMSMPAAPPRGATTPRRSFSAT